MVAFRHTMGRRLMEKVTCPGCAMLLNVTLSFPLPASGFPPEAGLLLDERVFVKPSQRRWAEGWEVGENGGLLIFERILL